MSRGSHGGLAQTCFPRSVALLTGRAQAPRTYEAGARYLLGFTTDATMAITWGKGRGLGFGIMSLQRGRALAGGTDIAFYVGDRHEGGTGRG